MPPFSPFQPRLSIYPRGPNIGVHFNGLTLHTFRRFMETHAINNGVPQRCVDGWLGHNADKSMGAVYYALSDEESQAFMRRLPLDRPPADT